MSTPRRIEFNGLRATVTGLYGEGYRPDKRILLVLGPAPCLFADLERFDPLLREADVMAVNRAGYLYPGRIKHWATVHPDCLRVWTPRRQDIQGNMDFLVHSQIKREPVEYVWGFKPGFGSSSGFAVYVGLCLGYGRIVLAGIPLDNTGYADMPGARNRYDKFKPMFEQAARTVYGGRVRTLTVGSYLHGLLGYPDEEWLRADDPPHLAA